MIKFHKINGWSYRTSDDQIIISNCGPRSWFSAEIDTEESKKFGWLIPFENSKQYHTSLKDAQNWVRNFNYSEKAGA
jgi:hypothetical protein